MFGSAFPTLAPSWCLAAGSSGTRVLLGPQPRRCKGTGITRAPPRGHGQRGNWGGRLPSEVLLWLEVLSTLRDQALGLLQLLFSQWIAVFYPPGTGESCGHSGWGTALPCIPPVSLVSPASPGHSMARPRWPFQAPSRRPAAVGPVGGCWWWPGHATLGSRLPCQPGCRASIPCHPACPLHPFVLWCHAGAVPRGDSIVHNSPHPSPLPPPAPLPWPLGSPGRARLGLGWGGSHFWHLPKKSMSCFVLVAISWGNWEPGVRVRVSLSVQGWWDPCRVSAWGVCAPAPPTLHAACPNHHLMEMSPWPCLSWASTREV